ncbi:hypothetical protein Ahy_A03g014617 [Arachis hypogaea]|uniref:Uncharacterized protein n=1 Tax=Arachis hypogaea TaxID=3818 RepID=A0A445DY74_ARAHY|nr:hypothetical protein Ahy_A03g014617 [Arachis hypogaea]
MRNVDVMRMCEITLKNDNIVHFYFDHPIDDNPDIIEEEVVFESSSESAYEINKPIDNVDDVAITNKKINETNGKLNEDVVRVNEVNDGVTETIAKVNRSAENMNERIEKVNDEHDRVNGVVNEGVNGVMNEEDDAQQAKNANKTRNHPREAREDELKMYQYESEELCSPPESDDKGKNVFLQHNPNTLYGQIALELNMDFETMELFKAAAIKYNIQIER